MSEHPELDIAKLRAAAEAMWVAENAYLAASRTRSKTLQDEALLGVFRASQTHVPKFTTPVLLALLDRIESAEAKPTDPHLAARIPRGEKCPRPGRNDTAHRP